MFPPPPGGHKKGSRQSGAICGALLQSNDTAPKGSLAKGSWHGAAVTEGFTVGTFSKAQTHVETCKPVIPPPRRCRGTPLWQGGLWSYFRPVTLPGKFQGIGNKWRTSSRGKPEAKEQAQACSFAYSSSLSSLGATSTVTHSMRWSSISVAVMVRFS